MSNIPEGKTLELPSFKGAPGLKLDIGATKEAESRLIEAKTVNPITYADLEHCFNEAYRELKRHLSTIGYQVATTDAMLRGVKGEVMEEYYGEYMKEKPKSFDNADVRDAYLIKSKEYRDTLDRLNQLKALETFFDGKLKVMENVCRYMRKRMDLVIRSGLSGSELYVTSGRKNG